MTIVYVGLALVVAFFTVALFPGGWVPALVLAPFVASAVVPIVALFVHWPPIDSAAGNAHKPIVDKRALGGSHWTVSRISMIPI
jgi:hypothetical protein